MHKGETRTAYQISISNP